MNAEELIKLKKKREKTAIKIQDTQRELEKIDQTIANAQNEKYQKALELYEQLEGKLLNIKPFRGGALLEKTQIFFYVRKIDNKTTITPIDQRITIYGCRIDNGEKYINLIDDTQTMIDLGSDEITVMNRYEWTKILESISLKVEEWIYKSE